jgi:hypothetical protein
MVSASGLKIILSLNRYMATPTIPTKPLDIKRPIIVESRISLIKRVNATKIEIKEKLKKMIMSNPVTRRDNNLPVDSIRSSFISFI